MLADFEQSNIDLKYLANYEYVIKVIKGDKLFSETKINSDYISKLESQLIQFVESQKITKPLIQRRNGIIKHLRKILTNKFINSKLSSFGSFESGLSLSNGDIDLCLEFDGDSPKKVLNKIARMLNQDSMKNVKLITNAKVPIVKFIDSQSMIPVDISVNNNLSVHNTELLRRYCDFDPRVKPFILAIKYWARNRGICEPTSGTFSSYAWTLIAINALQTMQEPVIPNLCTRDGTNVVEIGGQNYDVSMQDVSNSKFVSKNKETVAELLISFFSNLATNWPWSDFVISVREGKLITRKQKGWNHQKPKISNAIQDKKIMRLGKHSLPVEDPFDEIHDLSIVLDAEGVFEIRDEIIRSYSLLNESKNWEKICEVKYPELIPESPQLDLFGDLRGMSESEIKADLENLYSQLNIVEKSVSIRESERNDAIRMSKALRRNAELAKEQSVLSSELRPRRSQIDEAQSKRDSSNNNYIPVHLIEDELHRAYHNLTKQSETGIELSFEKEKALFSWFFELQSMHEHAKITRKHHREFLRLVNQQEKAIDHIKDIKHEIIDVKNLGNFRDFDDLAKRLLIELNPLKKERRKLRREVGRLEAWLRKQKHTPNKQHKNRKSRTTRRKNDTNVKEIKNKVISGDSFSLQDLDLLLKNGGIKSVNKQSGNNKKSNNPKTKKNKPTLQPHRGKRGKSSKNI